MGRKEDVSLMVNIACGGSTIIWGSACVPTITCVFFMRAYGLCKMLFVCNSSQRLRQVSAKILRSLILMY